jgi:hypothetical protein
VTVHPELGTQFVDRGACSVAGHQLVDFGPTKSSLDLLDGSRNCRRRAFGHHFEQCPKTFSLVTEVRVTSHDLPAEIIADMGRWEEPPSLLCVTEATGGTNGHIADRAIIKARHALALLRQPAMHGFGAKIYEIQVQFGPDGRYAFADGSVSGWRWRDREPLAMEFAGPGFVEWRETVAEWSRRYLSTTREIRSRVDTCLEWLDIGAMSENWRIALPALFSAMEALLVPESRGLKDGIVTVRSVAVHAAIEKPFFHPKEIRDAYEWRGKLVHGVPIPPEDDPKGQEILSDRRTWTFWVFRDFLQLAHREGFVTSRQMVTYLEREHIENVCRWLDEHGLVDVVKEYRKVVAANAPAAG